MSTIDTFTITVRHIEESVDVQTMQSARRWRVGVDVLAEITYEPRQQVHALEAVERLAASLRRQIADAAERTALEP